MLKLRLFVGSEKIMTNCSECSLSLKKPYLYDSCASGHLVASQFSELKMRNAHGSLRGPRWPSSRPPFWGCSPLIVCAVFHFLKVAPGPFRWPWAGQDSFSYRRQKHRSDWLKSKGASWLVWWKSPREKVRIKTECFIPVGYLCPLPYYLYSQSFPKGCVKTQLAS